MEDAMKQNKMPGYFYIPIYFLIMIILAALALFYVDKKAGVFAFIFCFVLGIVALAFFYYCKNAYKQDLIEFAMDYTQVQKKLVTNLKMPYAIIDLNGKFLWGNSLFKELCDMENNKYISDVFDEVNIDKWNLYAGYEENNIEGDKSNNSSNNSDKAGNDKDRNNKAVVKTADKKTADKNTADKNTEEEVIVSYNDHIYRLEYNLITIDSGMDDTTSNNMVAVYLFDETTERRLKKENFEQKMACGLVYIDNYDDVLESIEGVRGSLLAALIERRINKYFNQYNAMVKRLEKDKYLIVIKQKYISILQSNKFSLLDEVKNVNIGNEMAVTLSIGFGINAAEYTQNYEYSRIAMDLALGRGGDQAVLKDGEKLYFYGGKSKQVEKNTRVKARVKAHALRELLESKDKVIIMGHKLGDIDSLGAAMGIYRAAITIGKEAYIVVNKVTSSIKGTMENIKADSEYPDNVFISSEQAISLHNENTVVVIVDISRTNMVECPEILSKSKSIVVLDHHRRSSDTIENASLSYIEPFASSASEMVAEILQYFSDDLKIRNIEADAMYGGIMIDTNNFSNKAGVRTFEACAYLRKCGADVTRVHKMFRETFDNYKFKAKAISQAEAYKNIYAITDCPSEGVDSPTVLGARIANDMLDIRGVKASFVLTDYDDKIYISARSMGDLNVQLIMEKLGGGGHLDVAGAQIEDMSIGEVREYLKKTIDEMETDQEI